MFKTYTFRELCLPSKHNFNKLKTTRTVGNEELNMYIILASTFCSQTILAVTEINT